MASRVPLLDLRQAADGWHCIWWSRGVMHEFLIAVATLEAASFCIADLPWDGLYELRNHASLRLWKAFNGRSPGPEYNILPPDLREWHINSLRALDARQRGDSYRTIAEVLLGFHGTKEDWEQSKLKNQSRRLADNGIKMTLGGYRALLHYPITLRKR
jgi:hypothetical protein